MRNIQSFIKQHGFPLSLMLSINLCNMFYTIINGSNANRPIHDIVVGFDRVTPFLDFFIVPYIIWYPFIFLGLTYMCMRHRSEYYRAVVGLVIAHLLCYIVYILYQTTVPRPIIGDDTFFLRLVNFIYSHDEPYNCFPSIHVITTYLMLKSYKSINMNKIWHAILRLVGLSIIASTLFVKQHGILDVISAIVLAEIVYYAVSAVRFEDLGAKVLAEFSQFRKEKKKSSLENM